MCHLRPVFHYGFLSGWSVHWRKWGIKVPHYYCVIVNFSFYVCLLTFALYIEVLPCWVHIYLQLLYLLLGLIPWSLHSVFFVSCNSLYFKVYFVSYEYCYSSFLLISICIEYVFTSPHFQSVCVPRSEVGLL